ncbi:FtsX-like permease family protein [Myxococcota bacterium]|nr:FtsX-like permease family protein [Myxococcota bacterium]
MGMFLTIAARNLVQAKRRTLLIASALIMVTTLLVLLLALSRGLTETMIHSATTLSTGHLNVAGWFKSKPADAAPMLRETPTLRKIVEESTPGLDYVIDRHRGWSRIVSETGSVQVGLSGIDYAEEGRFFEAIQLAEEHDYKEGGRAQVLGDVSKLANPRTMMIFASQAKILGVNVGDQVTLSSETNTGARNTLDVTVVAIAKNVGMMSNWNAYLPKKDIMDLYNITPDTTGAVMVYLKDIEQAQQTMNHLRQVLTDKGYTLMDHDPQPFWMKFDTVAGEDWVGQKIDLTIWSDEVSFLTWVLTALDSISVMLVGILVVIIVIGIMNSMWISVRERTGEVGTLRAIGMGRGRVLVMFLVEALLLGLASTSVGALVGAAIAFGIDAANVQITEEAVQAILMSDRLHLSVQPGQLVAAIVMFTAMTALAALFPALRASRMQPVTAIQTVT